MLVDGEAHFSGVPNDNEFDSWSQLVADSGSRTGLLGEALWRLRMMTSVVLKVGLVDGCAVMTRRWLRGDGRAS
jgi:hypothetical protein